MLLLMKKIITMVVKHLSFVLEIPHSEFDNNFLINCFLWSDWHKEKETKLEETKKPDHFNLLTYQRANHIGNTANSANQCNMT